MIRCNRMNLVVIPDELGAKLALAQRVNLDKGETRYFLCPNKHYHLSR